MHGADLSRVLALLWRTAERPSLGGRLSVSRIVERAVDLADNGGLERVTMRALAEDLSVGTMSLYTHVPGKPELQVLMLDHVYGEDLHRVPAVTGWRDGIIEIAHSDRERFLRHPWLLQLTATRPPSGPNVTAKYDRDLEAVGRGALSAVEVDAAMIILDTFVQGAVRSEVAAGAARADGFTDADWWQAHQPYWSRVLDPEHFPAIHRQFVAVGRRDPDTDHRFLFEFGLDRLLDGIEVLLERRSRGRGLTNPVSGASPSRVQD